MKKIEEITPEQRLVISMFNAIQEFNDRCLSERIKRGIKQSKLEKRQDQTIKKDVSR